MATDRQIDWAKLLDARLSRSEFFTEGTVKVIPATSNVGPLGLFAFAYTTALLQGANTQLASDVGPLVIAMGFYYGGLVQLIAGILEYQRKNTFGCVAFSSFGAFWMALSYWLKLQVVDKVEGSVKGARMMLALWGVVTFLLWLCTFSMTVVTSALFLTLALLFFFLAAGQPQFPTTTASGVSYGGHENWMKFAGAWGFMVAGIAFYDGLAALTKEIYGKDILPVWSLKPVNQVTGGHFGTLRRLEVPDPEAGRPKEG